MGSARKGGRRTTAYSGGVATNYRLLADGDDAVNEDRAMHDDAAELHAEEGTATHFVNLMYVIQTLGVAPEDANAVATAVPGTGWTPTDHLLQAPGRNYDPAGPSGRLGITRGGTTTSSRVPQISGESLSDHLRVPEERGTRAS